MLVQFGMKWKMYGVQIERVPDDVQDVEAYLREHWSEIRLPKDGDPMAGSAELDPEWVEVLEPPVAVMHAFQQQFCGVFCDRGSLKTEDLLDAVMSVLDRIMDTDFGHDFKDRYSELVEWLDVLSPGDEEYQDAYEDAYDDAYTLLDEICMRHGCYAVVNPDDPTVMAIRTNEEVGDWL